MANRINSIHLRDILPVVSRSAQIDSVLAAIAYGSSASDETRDLIGHTIENQLRLDLWMRYDETVPVAIPLLNRLLAGLSKNIFTKFVPDCFHSKIIWWRGYGAYIGSANHTDRGWLTNIEAGIFIEDDELVSSGMDIQLDVFFDYLKALDKAIPISAKYVEEMKLLESLNKDPYAAARAKREHPEWDGPSFISNQRAFDRRKENFKTEWLETLGILQSIQEQVMEYRPVWVESTVPPAWQVDQFLHAYYYNQVGDHLRKPYEEYFQKNKANPNGNLITQLKWWQSLKSAPSNEDINIYVNAPELQRLLSKDKILTLTDKEFEVVCAKTHATVDHLIKVPMAELGRPDISSMDIPGRLKLFSPMLLNMRNSKGWDIRELLNYVLYEGKDNELWLRLYNAGRNREYHIARYGLNSIGEVVGWVRPDVAPPRNGRTSKALRALGFDVKVY